MAKLSYQEMKKELLQYMNVIKGFHYLEVQLEYVNEMVSGVECHQYVNVSVGIHIPELIAINRGKSKCFTHL